ncbi:MAG TPA: substrate-binding domain-containing protein, partial [Rubrivivax sp.]|nr:substrate-binding domain-containing protein [Rubrivivax sp.]
MPTLVQGFEALQPGAKVKWRSDGSGLLLEAMAQGQATDVLLAADADTVASGVRRHLLRPDPVRAFAGNTLVLLVPAASRLPIHRLADLARTEIKAPFDCVIASKRTEIGSYVNPGAVIAAVFESSPYEIRLPIPVDQLPLLDLKNGVGEPGGVEITSRIGDGTHT